MESAEPGADVGSWRFGIDSRNQLRQLLKLEAEESGITIDSQGQLKLGSEESGITIDSNSQLRRVLMLELEIAESSYNRFMESAETESDAGGWEVGSQSLLVSSSYPSHELILSADMMRKLKV